MTKQVYVTLICLAFLACPMKALAQCNRQGDQCPPTGSGFLIHPTICKWVFHFVNLENAEGDGSSDDIGKRTEEAFSVWGDFITNCVVGNRGKTLVFDNDTAEPARVEVHFLSDEEWTEAGHKSKAFGVHMPVGNEEFEGEFYRTLSIIDVRSKAGDVDISVPPDGTCPCRKVHPTLHPRLANSGYRPDRLDRKEKPTATLAPRAPSAPSRTDFTPRSRSLPITSQAALRV